MQKHGLFNFFNTGTDFNYPYVSGCEIEVNSGEYADTPNGKGGTDIICVEDIPIWHKVVLKPIGKGEKIFKYGEITGKAAVDIAAGALITSVSKISNSQISSYDFI